jgi:predicted nucleic acid-binding protein
VSLRVYLDTSVYNRPFDDQTQPRIWIETMAFALIVQMIEGEEVELVASSAVAFETSRNPDVVRQVWVNHCLGLARHTQLVDDGVAARARQLAAEGLKALDAVHVACAEAAGCAYFVTCDDRLIRRYRGPMVPVDPASLVRVITGDSV